MQRMEAASILIHLLTPVSLKIKHKYLPEKPWAACYRDVARGLTALKSKVRKQYDGLTELDIAKILNNYTESDIVNVLRETP